MTDVVKFVITGVAAMAIGLGIQRFGRSVSSSEPQKIPYLGGSHPTAHAWQRYHARYYPMTLLFIAFEMEMMFMYPWAVVFVEEGVKAMVEMGMFLAILSIGIIYGWRERIFQWQ